MTTKRKLVYITHGISVGGAELAMLTALPSLFANFDLRVIVFNTPSVSGCLGWKLGEYLCMGKAIVSSPLKRVMPGHTQEFAHFITNGSQMEGAIGRLKQDEAYRQDLERKASAYFQKYLTPKAIIQRIADHIPTQNTE